MNQNEFKKISLRNFKGQRELDVEAGHRTIIAGANATGKTTIFDAVCWCLFGKDSTDRTDSGRGAFAIKTLDSEGNVIDKLDHEVTIEMLHNGERLVLTRRLSERWVKKARAKEATFEGNTTTCIWNGAEVGVNEWNKRIEDEIMPISTFKMLTNPHYFSSLPWQEQLAELTRIIGEVSYADVAKDNPEFEKLLASIPATTTLKDRITTISTEHRRLKKRLDEIPSEIKGINAATPDAPEYGELECEQNALLQEQERIDEAQRSVADAERMHYEAIKAKQEQLGQIENKQFEVYSRALEAANQAAIEAGAAYSKLESDIRMQEQTLARITNEQNSQAYNHRTEQDLQKQRITKFQKQREELLQKWEETDAREYAAQDNVLICPLLGAPCDSTRASEIHRANQDKARATFAQQKTAELAQIEEEGRAVRDNLDAAQTALQKLEAEAMQTEAALDEKRSIVERQIEAMKQQLAQMVKPQTQTKINKAEIPAWMELHRQAEAIREEIAAMSQGRAPEATEQASQRKREIRIRLDQIAAELAKEKIIADNDTKIEKLEKESENVAQQMADLEQEEDTIKALQRAHIDEIERRANAKFSLVKFHTCDYQINGEPVQTCYATLDGVKYADLNSAGQVNAGLDIINTLCREYGITAPIFIDNAEGVNKLIQTDSQLIELVVTEDRPLKVTIEQE